MVEYVNKLKHVRFPNRGLMASFRGHVHMSQSSINNSVVHVLFCELAKNVDNFLFDLPQFTNSRCDSTKIHVNLIRDNSTR